MKATVIKPITEAEFVRQILQLAAVHGWRSFRVRPGRTVKGWRTCVEGNGVGWPDIFLARERTGELIAMEAKVGNNRLSPEQLAWLRCLRACGIPATVVRPSDWSLIEKALE